MTKVDSPRSRAGVAGFSEGAPGVTPPTVPARQGDFLSDVVVELGFADRKTVDDVIEAGRESGKFTERLLLESGTLDEGQLSRAIAERNGLDHVDLDEFPVDAEAAAGVDLGAARRCRAAPIAFTERGALIVAVGDPLDALGTGDIEAMTDREVRLVVAAPSGIAKLLERLADEPARPSEPDEAGAGSRPGGIEIRTEETEGLAASRFAPVESSTESPPAEVERPAPSRSDGVDDRPEGPPAEAGGPGQTVEVGAEDATAEIASLEAEAPEGSQRPDESGAMEDGGLSDLSAGVGREERTPRGSILAGDLGRRIRELEGAAESAGRVERELVEARGRIADLERRLTEVVAAARQAAASTESLTALNRVLEDGGR
jgi:hypothetical protein